MKVNKIEDSISLITSKEKPLAAYLFSNDKNLKEEFIASVSAGGIAINDTTLHVSLSPVPYVYLQKLFKLSQLN